MDKEKKETKKEHKKSWQETYATPEEIKAMLDSRVWLRYNEVRGRPEIQRTSPTATSTRCGWSCVRRRPSSSSTS